MIETHCICPTIYIKNLIDHITMVNHITMSATLLWSATLHKEIMVAYFMETIIG